MPNKRNEDMEDKLNPIELVYYRIIDPEINSNYDSWIEDQNCWICERWHKIHIKYALNDKNFLEDSELRDFNYKAKEKLQDIPKKNLTRDQKHDSILMKNQFLVSTLKSETTLSQLKNKSSTQPEKIMKPELEFKICGSFTQDQNENLLYDCKTGNLNYCNYVPPGLHKYKIIKINTITQEILTLTETDLIVKQRDREIQQHRVKVPHNDKIKPKQFIFLRSVFKDFRMETKTILDRCFEIDWKKVKINQFVNTIDAPKIKKSVYDNFLFIKNVFIYRISISKSYPTLGWLIFMDFCNEISVLDDKVKILQLHRAFTAVNMENDAPEDENIEEDNSAQELCRYEFIEILIRLAVLKYYNTRICQSYLEAWGIIIHYVNIHNINNRKIFE